MKRQRKWQQDQLTKGNCTICGKNSEGLTRCPACTVKQTEQDRERTGYSAWQEGGRGRPPKYKEQGAASSDLVIIRRRGK